MKNWIWLLIITILMLFLHGCATTRSGGVEKRYDVRINVADSDNVSFSMGVEADTSAESTAGDADATVDPRLSASVYGPSQIDGVMKDLSYIIEKWNKINAENTDNSDNSTNQNPPEPPDTGNGASPDEPGGTGDIIGVDTVLYTFPCEDLNFTYRDCELDEPGCESVPQMVCLFTDFEKCEDIPVESFTMMWRDPTGNERFLEVADRCVIAMDNEANGYGKFRPAHDKEPFKPVAYAPRGFNASEVNVIGKK